MARKIGTKYGPYQKASKKLSEQTIHEIRLDILALQIAIIKVVGVPILTHKAVGNLMKIHHRHVQDMENNALARIAFALGKGEL